MVNVPLISLQGVINILQDKEENKTVQNEIHRTPR